MHRYEAFIGVLEIDGSDVPIFYCEVLADNLDTAEYIMEFMGYRKFGFRKPMSLPHWHEHQLN